MTHNLRKSCRELGWRNIAAAHAVQRSRNAAKVQRSRNAAKVVQMLHSFQSPLVTCSRRIDGVSHTIQQPASIVMCTKEGRRFRCVTRCSNEELCRNAHVCIQHFVAFHNASPVAKIDTGSSDEEWKMRSPPSSWTKNILLRENCTLQWKVIPNRKLFNVNNIFIALLDFLDPPFRKVTWVATWPSKMNNKRMVKRKFLGSK